jgi:hypothetical protein
MVFSYRGKEGAETLLPKLIRKGEGEVPTRLRHSADRFEHPPRASQVMHDVDADDEIKALVVEGQPLCVGHLEVDPWKLILCNLDHLLGKIDADDIGSDRCVACGEDAGTAPDVEDFLAGP